MSQGVPSNRITVDLHPIDRRTHGASLGGGQRWACVELVVFDEVVARRLPHRNSNNTQQTSRHISNNKQNTSKQALIESACSE